MEIRFDNVAVRALTLTILVLGGAFDVTGVRASALFDASLGTLPQAQGWVMMEDIQPVAAYPLGVAAGELHLSTLGFGSNVPPNVGGGVWWQRHDVPLDFSGDFAIELDAKIVDAPDHATNQVAGWPRPGYALAAYDVQGRLFWLGLGRGEVMLSNTTFGFYGTANTLTIPFNTTDAHHVYRIERAAGGIGAALRIDGVKRLELPAFGPVLNDSALIYFGDPTYWANSESFTSMVRVSSPTLGVRPPTSGEPLWVRPLGSPARRMAVAYAAHEPGVLTLDVFDVTGRRVATTRREVAAGQSGTIELPDAQADGLYYYRATLAGGSARDAVASGRIVVIR